MALTNSFVGIFSMWLNTSMTGVWQGLFAVENSELINPSNVGACLIHPDDNQFEIYWNRPPSTNQQQSFVLLSDAFLTPNTWHHILCSWDSSGPSFVGGIWIDDVPGFTHQLPYSSQIAAWDEVVETYVLSLDPDDIDFTSFFPLQGCVYNLYLNTQEYLDFSITSNRRKFISASMGVVDLGTNGELPTGTSPSWCFQGDGTGFLTNRGTEGVFSAVGPFVDCTYSNPPGLPFP